MAEPQLLIAKYNYDAQEAKELSIEKNELLTVLDASGKWWKVCNEAGAEGFVPSNFVRHVTWKDAIGRRLGMLKESLRRRNPAGEQLSTNYGPPPPPPPPPSSSSWANKRSAAGADYFKTVQPPSPTVLCTADVCFDYVPCRDDELTLRKGDHIDVLEKSTDGWWRGLCNHQCGWFPSNYVAERRSRRSPPPNLANGSSSTPDHRRRPSETAVANSSSSASAVDASSTSECGKRRHGPPPPPPPSAGDGGWSPKLPIRHSCEDDTLQSTRLRAVANGSAKQLYASKHWYFGKLSREASQKLLDQHGSDGDFLIRDSESNPGDLSISLKAPVKNKHFWIQVDNDGFRIGNRRFASIDELIDHYTNKPISSNGRGENLYLIKPCGRP